MRRQVGGFEEFEDHIWSIEESTRILIELSNIYPSVTLIIDALDEVNQVEKPEVLNALDEVMAKSDNLVKIFISSRDNVDIWHHLESSPNIYIDVEHNAKDIAQFIWVLRGNPIALNTTNKPRRNKAGHGEPSKRESVRRAAEEYPDPSSATCSGNVSNTPFVPFMSTGRENLRRKS